MERREKEEKKKLFVLLSRVVRSPSVDPRRVPPKTQVYDGDYAASSFLFDWYRRTHSGRCLVGYDDEASCCCCMLLKTKGIFFWHTIFYSISFLCLLWDAFATINFLTNFLPIFGGNIACVFLPVSQLEVSSKFERASSSPGKELFRFSPRSLSQRRKIVI